MNICLVTPGYPPRIGGVEAHVGQLARGLHRLGCTVTVFTQVRRDDPAAGTISCEDGIEVRRFRDATGSDHFELAPSLVRALRRDVDTFDVVHAHSFHGAPALATAFVTHVPLVFTPHYHGVGHTPMARVVHLAYDPLAGVIFRKASAVICVSDAEAARLGDDYRRAVARTVVVPNGVDRGPIDAVVPFDRERPLVLAVGRLETYKQVDRVIAALEYLPGDMDLVVVGDGPARDELRRAADDSGHRDRVIFAGRVDDGELRRWQRTAAVTVCLSRQEAFGLVLAEAVVAGSPIVASDIPAHREVAESAGGTVDLVPVDIGSADLARRIEDAAGSLSFRAADSSILDWSEVARRTLDVYRSTVPVAVPA